MNGSVQCGLVTLILLLSLVVACQNGGDNNQQPTPSPSSNVDDKPPVEHGSASSSGTWLTEITAATGLPDEEVAWPDGLYYTPEITPGGVALLDYDLDGDLDIYVVRHCAPGPLPDSFNRPAPNQLFQQQADGRFVEVPGAAGLDDPGFGHGASVGDVDNDGDPDVFVTNYGPDRLFLNDGSGSFVDATANSGISGNLWSSASAFCDYDQDGDLDLFVVHFATFDASRRCSGASAENPVDYCGPHLFDGLRDQLFRNDGRGTFVDVSEASGIVPPARGWGIIATDLTGDGQADIYVCNDEEPNQLWVSQGDGTFEDEAVYRGVAFNGFGRVEASMGVTVGDVDGDGTMDLFMTHVTSETNTLYTLDGEELYSDASSRCGTAAVDLPYTGWGCGFFDLENDGDLDLAVANGRVAIGTVDPRSKHGAFWDRYAEPNLLFLNDGTGKYSSVTADSGSFGGRPEVTRGLAFGDLDNDGDLDLVTNDIANRLRVFRNDGAAQAGPENHWLIVRATTGKRSAIGATVTVFCGAEKFIRPVLRAYSYLSSNDPRAHFGLGPIDKIDRVEVRWPDGAEETFMVGPEVNREVPLRQGEGDG